MQGNLSQTAHTRLSSLSLGGNHGYRFEGDLAILNAELALSDVDGTFDGAREQPEQQWALQLWACEMPYQGGPLHGLKVAEAELALPTQRDEPTRLETTAFARLPPTQGEYAMVLVLASGDRGRYDQVHDFSNYAERQQFTGPRLDGSVGYRIEGDDVVLQADAVSNSRGADNLSGTLALELWALHGPYQGGPLQGQLLAQATLGCLEGQNEQRFVEQRVQLTDASPGTWDVALVLREWTSAEGYVTRDYCNFSAPHIVTGDSASTTPSRDFVAAWQAEPVYADQDDFQAEPTPAQPVAVEAPAVVIEKAVAIAAPAEPAPTKAVEAKPAQTKPVVQTKPVESKPVLQAKLALQAKPVVQAKSAVQTKPADAKAAQAASAKAVVQAEKAAPAQPVQAAASTTPSEDKTETRRVSVQTASVDELAAVPGLNKKLAQSIVKARPFGALEDVVKVRGIGDKMLQQLRERLTL